MSPMAVNQCAPDPKTESIYVDYAEDKLLAHRMVSGHVSLRMLSEGKNVAVAPEDLPEVLRAIARVAQADVLIIPKPTHVARQANLFDVTPSPTGDGRVNFSNDGYFACKLNVFEIAHLIWQLAEAAAEVATTPRSEDVQALATDLGLAGTPLFSAAGIARKLLSKGYRKDPAVEQNNLKPAAVFNALPGIADV